MDLIPANLESLPSELIIQVLQNLPAKDIISICRSSRHLNAFCQDWGLWTQEAFRDFGFPRELFRRTTLQLPVQRYQQVQAYHDNPDQFLIPAVRSGNTRLLQYLVDAGAENLDIILRALELAAAKGDVQATRLLLQALRLPQRDENGEYNDEELEQFSERMQKYGVFTEDFEDLLDEPVRLAARNNHLLVIQELLRAGTHDLSQSLFEAALRNYSNILPLLLQAARRGPGNSWLRGLNYFLAGAAGGGHVNLVQEALELGADDLDGALVSAAEQGQIGMIDFLRQHGANDLDRAFRAAARSGQIVAMPHLLQAGATDLNGALQAAANQGHLKAVKFLLQLGATDVDAALYWAAGSGHVEVVKALIQAGATKLNQALIDAALGGHLPVIQELIKAGATNLEQARKAAAGSIFASPKVSEYLESIQPPT